MININKTFLSFSSLLDLVYTYVTYWAARFKFTKIQLHEIQRCHQDCQRDSREIMTIAHKNYYHDNCCLHAVIVWINSQSYPRTKVQHNPLSVTQTLEINRTTQNRTSCLSLTIPGCPHVQDLLSFAIKWWVGSHYINIRIQEFMYHMNKLCTEKKISTSAYIWNHHTRFRHQFISKMQ